MQSINSLFRISDFSGIIRSTFSGFLLVTILQKIIDSNQFENLSKTIFNLLLYFSVNNVSPLLYKGIFTFIIGIELFILIGIYKRKTFDVAVVFSFTILSIGILSSIISIYYGLNNSCGCGLFGENPYLLLFQKAVLFAMLIFIGKNKKIYFPRGIV